MNNFKSRNFIESFIYAAHGVVHAYRTQRNLRVHLLMAVLVVVVSVALDLSYLELAIILLAIGLVIACELINTAIEGAIDLITAEYHPLAKMVKNVAAAAVLVAAGTAAGIGVLLFYDRLAGVDFHRAMAARSAAMAPYLILISLALVLVFVMFIKTVAGTVGRLDRKSVG